MAIVLVYLLMVAGSNALGTFNPCPQTLCTLIDMTNINNKTIKCRLNDECGVYCMKAIDDPIKGLHHIFHNVHISVSNKSSTQIALVSGNSTAMINKELEEMDIYVTSWLTNNYRELLYSPFTTTNCFGIKSTNKMRIDQSSAIIIITKKLQVILPVLLILGLVLFLIAPYITRNVTFYYTGGIMIGIIASLLILLYVFGKLIPKKNMLGLGILVGGYSLIGYVAHWIYSQGLVFLLNNWLYVSIYIVLGGLVSFAVLYRIGPAHPRTIELIQWSIQLIALIMIFISLHQVVIVGGISVVLLLIFYNVKISQLCCRFCCCLRPFVRCFRKRKMMIKKEYITMEEYDDQGRVETRKALRELRNYCRTSPNFWEDKQYALENQKKFINFVSGHGDHVTQEECDYYETSFGSDGSTSSSDDDGNDDGSPTPSILYSSKTPSPYISSSSISNSPTPTRSNYYYY